VQAAAPGYHPAVTTGTSTGSAGTSPAPSDPPAPGATGWARWAARHHPIVWWLVAIKLTAALAFTVLVPFYRGPDEIDHYSMLRWHAENTGYPVPTRFLFVEPALLAVGVPLDRATSEWPPMRIEDAVPRPDRPTLVELDATAVPQTDPTNQLSQHPPLYYVLTEGVVGTLGGLLPDGAWSWDRLGLAYRWGSVLAAGLLPLVASAAALAAGMRRRAAAVAAAFVFLVPQHTYIGAVVNNDSFTTLFAGVAVVGALRWLARPDQRRWALAAAGAAGVAVASKSTALSVLVWLVGVGIWIVLRALRDRAALGREVLTLGSVLVVGAVGAGWQLTQLVRFGDFQPSGYSLERRAGIDPTGGDFVREWVSRVSTSFWGSPASATGIELSRWVVVVASVVTLALVAVAVLVPWWRRRGRTVPTALSVLIVGQVLLMVETNWRGYFRTQGVNAFQGRYLFVVLVPLAVLVALGVVHVVRLARGRVDPLGVAVVFAGVGVALHAVLSVQMLERFWGPVGGTWGEHVDALLAWSPLPVALTWPVVLSPWLVTVAGVVTWAVRRRGAPPERASADVTASAEARSV
jgi:hypothetical protein